MTAGNPIPRAGGAPAIEPLGYWPSGDGDGGGWPVPPARPPGGRGRGLLLVAAALVVAAALGVGVYVGHVAWTRLSVPTSVPPSTVPSGSAVGAPPHAKALATATDPGLVDIDIVDSYQAVEGAGTGMVLSSDGEVLTNNHVIEDATRITATDVGDHRTYQVKVVGYDPTQDVAVLQLTGAAHLHTVRLGDSSSVAVGDGVVAVGNAEGAGGTPSWAAGSVTAIDQSITAQDEVSGATEQLHGMIETNCDIVPGDSGGALVDSAGRVIGMNTAASEGFRFQPGVTQGYAIPIDQARTITGQIEAGQSSSTVHVGPTAFLGVEVATPVSGVAGAQIVDVFAGSPAARAGLTRGDVITAVGGHTVSSPASLSTLLLGETPGTSVSLTVQVFFGISETVTVQLGSGPPQ